MKTRTLIWHPSQITDGAELLNKTIIAFTQLSSKGYKVHTAKYDTKLPASMYRITIFYSGNIFQRAWRKLTQW